MDIIELALEIIECNNGYKSNHLTFISLRNRIISIGKNYEDRTHTLAKKFGYIDEKIHSELDAVIRFTRKGYRLSRCIIWNVRVDRWGKVKNSKPCRRCQKMLIEFGAKRINWTTDKGEWNGRRILKSS